MKLNWGNALLIFFICYVSFLIFILAKSTQVDHSLVVENYYNQDIHYQEKYDKVNNRNLLKDDVKITYQPIGQIINFDFGSVQNVEEIDVQMYRASDVNSDFKKNIKVDQLNSYDLNLPELKNGKWTLKLEWKDNIRSYYKEEDIYISKA